MPLDAFWLGIEYGATQVLAIVYVAIGSSIVVAAVIVKVSRWYRGRDVLNRVTR